MKIQMFACGTLVALAACSTVHDYYPNSQVVTVDGVEYMVRPMNSGKTSWQATPNRPDGRGMIFIDASIYMGNVKAIEAATGCPVFGPSVKNQNTDTIAAVDCSAKPAQRG